MCTQDSTKLVLPIQASPEIMELLIKAKHFFAHATLHSQSGSVFDSMISIHSLDNSIEYLLRILIKHLDIENRLSKTINTPELMALFSEVDNFLWEHTLLDGKGCRLPYKNEIQQLRGLRNNVQHGMILPINELRNFLKYGDRFFERVLRKVFGLTPEEICYSTIVENEQIRQQLSIAEGKIANGEYLEAVVACRNAYELGQFFLQDKMHHFTRMAAIPHIKQTSLALYDYIKSIDDEITVLGAKTNLSDYRLYKKYIRHIPGQYNATRAGYSVMPRDWEKHDADFCYSFVAQAILNLQLDQERPIYEIDMPKHTNEHREVSINGVTWPELYPEKCCMYTLGNNSYGELYLINNREIKNRLMRVAAGDICYLSTKFIAEDTGIIMREFSVYVRVDALECDVVLNHEPLWEFLFCYCIIPFTEISKIHGRIDIDSIKEYVPQNEKESHAKEIIQEFGSLDTIEKAFQLDDILTRDRCSSEIKYRFFSSMLIHILQEQAKKL